MVLLAGAAAVLLWIAAVYRLVVSLSAPATLWRWSFTVAVVALAAGVSVFVLGTGLDRVAHVDNVGQILVHLLVGTSAGGVSIYLLTLRSDRANPWHVAGAGLVTVIALSLMVISWFLAPFHAREYSDIALAPLTAAGVTYFVTWYAYLCCVLCLTAGWCFGELRATAHEQHSVRAGLRTIGIASSIAAVGFLVGLLRVVLRATTGNELTALSTVVRTLDMLSLIGIASGTVVFLLAPRLAQWRRQRQLVTHLGPLADRIRELYPGVVLGEDQMGGQPTTVRAQRLVIEISDGLRMLPIRPDPDRPATQLIAETLASSTHLDTGSTATDLLPPNPSIETERQILLEIADRYTRADR